MPIPSYTSSQSFLAISVGFRAGNSHQYKPTISSTTPRTATSRKKAASFPVALGEFGYEVTR